MAATASVAVRTLFSPFDDTTGEFLQFVASAQRAIAVVIYGFHLPKLTDLLIAKHNAGVQVALILDHTQEAGKAEKGEVQRLVDAGVPLLIGTSPVHHQILHSKFTVVDGCAVEFGSWNYSLSASQQSNTMSIISDAGYAASFLAHFDRLRAFILLHEMALQVAGEVALPSVAHLGSLESGVESPVPAAIPSSQAAGSVAPSASAAPVQESSTPSGASGATPTTRRPRRQRQTGV